MPNDERQIITFESDKRGILPRINDTFVLKWCQTSEERGRIGFQANLLFSIGEKMEKVMLKGEVSKIQILVYHHLWTRANKELGHTNDDFNKTIKYLSTPPIFIQILIERKLSYPRPLWPFSSILSFVLVELFQFLLRLNFIHSIKTVFFEYFTKPHPL